MSRNTEAPIKVLHLITGLSTGGAETVLRNTVTASSRERFAHSVISMSTAGEIGPAIERSGIPVVALDARPGRLPSPLLFWRLARAVRGFRPDVLQCWMYHANLAGTLVRPLAARGVPTAWNIRHSLYDISDESRWTARVIRLGARLSKRADAIVYNAAISAEQHEDLGYRREFRTVIHNGFDTTIFRADDSARVELRRELGLESDAKLVGVVGRYHPAKRHVDYLDAAARVDEQVRGVHSILVGRGLTKDNEPLVEEVRRRGLERRVHLVGERSDIPRVMAALDVLCSSSSGEGMSNVIGEAMSAGTPCVVTDVGESSNLVGPCGSVTPPRNPDALAVGLVRLLRLDPDARRALGVQARDRIERKFSLKSSVERYESLWSSLAGGAKRE